MQPLVSIVVIFQKENAYLVECFNHCMKLDYDNYELILLPDEGVSARFQQYITDKGLPARVMPTGKAGVSKKRNVGIENAKGEYIAFIDDDAYPRYDWLKEAIPLFKDPVIGAVGGPNLTPVTDPWYRRIAGNLMQSRIVFGAGYVRHIVGMAQFIDELPTCNLIVRRSILNEIKFDENLYPGEDTKLCFDIGNKGLKIYYFPEVLVYHHRRALLMPFLKQFHNYGVNRGKLMREGNEWQLFHVVPALFFLFVAVGWLSLFTKI